MQAWHSAPVPRLDPAPELGPVAVYDTASARVRPVGPEDGTARLYVCGITPYDATHMGHANTYVAFDLLHRAWLDAGLEVSYVQNVTDVDDPLLERARSTGVDWQELAETETELFRTDMRALNVLAPHEYVGAVESIPLVVDLLRRMPEGSLYQVPDRAYPDWYFDVSTDPQFGQLSGLSLDQARPIFAERGGDPDRAGKRNPLDCLVWQQQRPNDPAWRSPFGLGRPGWHIECTAIALRYLGTTFDVQAGGSDLIFPHHEMCAAEGQVVTGHPFAAHYVHAGMVGLDGEKMSKSRGNLVLVSRLRADGVDPMAIRLALLEHHYRTDWHWTPELLEAAQRRLALWRRAAGLAGGIESGPTVEAVRRALRDDLDAAAAIAAVDAWAAASLDAWAAASLDADALDADAPARIANAVDALLGVRL